MSPAGNGAPRGRRPGSPDTRAAILGAARAGFAELGFRATTIRAVASEAGVDAALVHHYFGTKEQVFVAAMELPFEPGELLPQALAGDPEELRERLARMFLGI